MFPKPNMPVPKAEQACRSPASKAARPQTGAGATAGGAGHARGRAYRKFSTTITAYSLAIPFASHAELGLAANGSRDLPESLVKRPHTHTIILITGALSACSSSGDNPLTVFTDPGKYQYFTCEQIAANHKVWSAKEQELKMLMDKADQGAGGTVVSVLAYKADHVAANEEIKVLDVSAHAKNCENPANWSSNSAVR